MNERLPRRYSLSLFVLVAALAWWGLFMLGRWASS